MGLYEGFINHETWSAYLSLNTNYDTYQVLETLRHRDTPVTAEDFKSLNLTGRASDYLKNEDPDFDMSEVDWNDIAESIEAERLAFIADLGSVSDSFGNNMG